MSDNDPYGQKWMEGLNPGVPSDWDRPNRPESQKPVLPSESVWAKRHELYEAAKNRLRPKHRELIEKLLPLDYNTLLQRGADGKFTHAMSEAIGHMSIDSSGRQTVYAFTDEDIADIEHRVEEVHRRHAGRYDRKAETAAVGPVPVGNVYASCVACGPGVDCTLSAACRALRGESK